MMSRTRFQEWAPRRGDPVKLKGTDERGVVLRTVEGACCGQVFVAFERRSVGQCDALDHVRPVAAGALELDGDDLAQALDDALSMEALAELAFHGRGVRCLDELAALLEVESVRALRASDGYAERRRYDLAALERDRAAMYRRRAEAIRVLERRRTQS